jgi:hypothetical protein
MRKCIALLVAACAPTPTGAGIGIPSHGTDAPPDRLPILITEVSIAAGQVEISIDAGACDNCAPVELTGLQLCADDCALLAGQVETGRRLLADVGALFLSRNAGHIAVVDDEQVHAYAAWGAPGRGPWSTRARAQGLSVHFAPIGYPIPAEVNVAWEDTAGCAAPSLGSVATIDEDLCPAVAALQLTEVLPDWGDGVSFVEVQNAHGEALDLEGVRLCAGPACAVLPANTLAPGAFLRIDGDFASTGEVGLWAPGRADLSDGLQSRLRWQDVQPPRLAGESLARADDGSWRASAASPGAANPAAWSSCSYPEAPAAATGAAIVAVDRGRGQVEIEGEGTLALDGVPVTAPGAVALGASGTLELRTDGALAAFMQWGEARAADEAVALGLWPLPSCALPLLGAEDRLVRTAAPGRSPADYAVAAAN